MALSQAISKWILWENNTQTICWSAKNLSLHFKTRWKVLKVVKGRAKVEEMNLMTKVYWWLKSIDDQSWLMTKNQTWTYCSTILLGPRSWPFFGINPQSFAIVGLKNLKYWVVESLLLVLCWYCKFAFFHLSIL